MKKRSVIYFVIVSLLFASLGGRLFLLAQGRSLPVQEGYHSFSVVIDRREPNIYYRNLKLLTNNLIQRAALIPPSEKAVGELSCVFSLNEVKDITQQLKGGKPVLKEVAPDTELKYSKIYNTAKTEYSCRQLIAADCSGLLSYYEKKGAKRSVRFSVDALGRMLSGDEGALETEGDYYDKSGLVLTLDEKIQRITAEACRTLKNGCALVLDVSDASVLACVTKPDDSYLNKPMALYPVGSVFKTVVAACALENRMDPVFDCTSAIQVGDTVYSCQKEKAHGVQHLREALANSCNCYFVNLALTLGAEKLMKTAHDFGLSDSTVLYRDFKFQNAALPDASALKTKGELALLGFGQGSLLATPAAIGNVYCTVAGGGTYCPVCLVYGEMNENGKLREEKAAKPKRIMTEQNAAILLDDLRAVVAQGTGSAADYEGNVAGKTATAQTGQLAGGREILNTWFAGIYPYDHPKYVIVIMCEDGSSGAHDCCPIFRTIVEKLDRM